jgi:hypothetical protein
MRVETVTSPVRSGRIFSGMTSGRTFVLIDIPEILWPRRMSLAARPTHKIIRNPAFSSAIRISCNAVRPRSNSEREVASGSATTKQSLPIGSYCGRPVFRIAASETDGLAPRQCGMSVASCGAPATARHQLERTARNSGTMIFFRPHEC